MMVVTAKMETLTLIRTSRYAVCIKRTKLIVRYVFPEEILFLLRRVTFEYIQFLWQMCYIWGGYIRLASSCIWVNMLPCELAWLNYIYTWHKMCVLISSTQEVLNVLMQSDCYFYLIWFKLPTSLTEFIKNTQYKITQKIHPTWAQLLHADKRTDRQNDIKPATFHNSA
jgi:hypothetical protein